MTSAPLGRLICGATRRWSHRRLVRACAYHLGTALAEPPRVLRARVETGSPILVTSLDHAHRQIFFFGSYEAEITALFKQLVTPGMAVFDVGANVGYFSLIASDLGAVVHAFEPHPALADMIRRSASLAGANVTVIGAACSDTEGSAELHLAADGQTAISSLEADAGGLGLRRVAVPTVTLDGYIRETGIVPQLVKIDVERHEHRVIAGARHMLAETQPDVIAEITRPDTLAQLLGYGYRAWLVTADGLQPTTDLGPSGWGNVYLRVAERNASIATR